MEEWWSYLSLLSNWMCYSGDMTDQPAGDINRSIRMSHEMFLEVSRRAEEMDRSFNWVVKRAIQLYLESGSAADGFKFPEQTIPTAGAQYRATVHWRMPNFGDMTDDVIENMLTEVAHLIGRYDVRGSVVVDDIIPIGPVRMGRLTRIEHWPEGTGPRE